jgi:hypothetical protein
MRSALVSRDGSRLQQSASLQLHSRGHRPVGLSIPLFEFLQKFSLSALAVTSCSGHTRDILPPLYVQRAGGS